MPRAEVERHAQAFAAMPDTLLVSLARLPSALTAADAPGCAAAILGRVEGEREAVPLALVASGLTASEINLALDALRLGLTRKEAA